MEPTRPDPAAPPELRPLPRQRRTARPAAPAASSPGPAPPAAVRAPRPETPEAIEDLPPIERLPRDGPLPASFYQQWAWEWLNGKPTADLNIPFVVRFGFPLSLPALFGSLGELERRHEGLRTRFVRIPDRPWTVGQRIDPPGALAVPLIDLSSLDPAAREREMRRLAAFDALCPHGLNAPLFRVRLVRLGETDHILLMSLCHLIGDGWSVELLRGELAALYAAFAAGRPSPLPELPVQFADFAAWQRRITGSATMARQLAYWRRRLDAVPIPYVLPGDWPNLPRGGRGTVQAVCGFSPRVTARLRDLARAQGATPAILLLTGFGLLLTVYTGETDIVIESMVLGRPRAELASIVGLFVNTLPHRTDFSGLPSFAEALRRTRDGVVEDYCNQDLSFPRLMLELYPGRRYLSRVGFNMLRFPTAPSLDTQEQEQAVFRYEGRQPDLVAPKYDLMVMGHEDQDHLRLVLVGAAARFNDATAAAIAADLEALLVHALEEPEAPVARLLPRSQYRSSRPTAP